MSGAEFVANLAIPEPHEYANLMAVAGSERAAIRELSFDVICGCLCCFCDVTSQDKMDVTNSILLAQLAANKASDRFQKPLDWYNSYSKVLSNIGWNVPAASFQSYGSVDTANLDQAVLSIARSFATPTEVDVLAGAVGAARYIGDLPGPHPCVSIWNTNSSNGGDANFQLMVVASRDGSVTALMIGCSFRATPSQIRFLSWGANPELQRVVVRLELNSDVHSRIRQTIVNKLEGKAATFVANVTSISSLELDI